LRFAAGFPLQSLARPGGLPLGGTNGTGAFYAFPDMRPGVFLVLEQT
jgi:hypothetical protein